jgi:hypothetical protein
MATAGVIVDLMFFAVGLVPTGPRHANVTPASVSFDYTTVLNIVFLVSAAALVWRFVATGGIPMLRMMNRAPAATEPAPAHHQ